MPDVTLSPELLLGVAALAALPFLLISTTAFIKIAVVLSLVRNALGIQQIPPNIVIYSLSLVLTVYIMFPVGAEALEIVLAAMDAGQPAREYFIQAIAPINAFLERYTGEAQLQFFSTNIKSFWEGRIDPHEDVVRLFTLIPAFTITELSEAFKIGFLIYLPFIAIDIAISNILLSMGMMTVSPVTISLPFKLFLFVTVDGWTRLIKGLIMTYS